MKIYKFFYLGLIFSLSFLYGSFNPLMKTFIPTSKEKKDGAVILQKKVTVKIDNDAKRKITTYYLIAILDDEAARDYGQIDFPYNTFYQEKKLNYARVIDKNGTIKNLDKEAIQIRSPQNYNSYDDTKTLVFSLASISVGSFIELEVVSSDKKNIIPHETSGNATFVMWQTNRSTNHVRIDSLRESKYSIEINKGYNLYFHLTKKAHLLKEEKKKSVKYTWTIENIKAQKLEQATLFPYSSFTPQISYSTMRKWDIFNDYFFKIYDNASTPNEKIITLAKEITKDVTSLEDKVKLLFNFVQDNIKYIFAHLGKGGMFPHSAPVVLENKYGDCKDQTIFFISLLKSLNIEAYPALINSYPNNFEKRDAVSSRHFNHVITYIPKLHIFIDTTGYSSYFPGILWSLKEKNSFILNSDKGLIKQLTQANRENIKLNIEMKIESKKLMGKLHYFPSPQVSNGYKSMIANTQNAKLLLEKDFNSLYQRAETQSFKIMHTNTSDKLLEIIWTFTIDMEKENLSQYVFSGIMNSFLSRLLPIYAMERVENRVHGFKYGYPIRFDINSTFILPDNMYRLYTEGLSKKLNNKYYSYQSTHLEDENGTHIYESFKTKQYKIPKNEYASFYNKTKEIIQNTRLIAVFKKDEFKQKEVRLKYALSETKNSAKMIELAEYYLDTSKYKESKKIIEEVLSLEPKNAKAHYICGIILGYMDEFDKSDEEFKKAHNLGYKK